MGLTSIVDYVDSVEGYGTADGAAIAVPVKNKWGDSGGSIALSTNSRWHNGRSMRMGAAGSCFATRIHDLPYQEVNRSFGWSGFRAKFAALSGPVGTSPTSGWMIWYDENKLPRIQLGGSAGAITVYYDKDANGSWVEWANGPFDIGEVTDDWHTYQVQLVTQDTARLSFIKDGVTLINGVQVYSGGVALGTIHRWRLNGSASYSGWYQDFFWGSQSLANYGAMRVQRVAIDSDSPNGQDWVNTGPSTPANTLSNNPPSGGNPYFMYSDNYGDTQAFYVNHNRFALHAVSRGIQAVAMNLGVRPVGAPDAITAFGPHGEFDTQYAAEPDETLFRVRQIIDSDFFAGQGPYDIDVDFTPVGGEYGFQHIFQP